MKKRIMISMISLFIIVFVPIFSFAATDEAKLFYATELSNYSYTIDTMPYIITTYQKLGYNLRSGNVSSYITTTDSRNTVLNYINEAGNNYAIFVYAHGRDGAFTMSRDGSNAPQIIYSSDISGNWHFVFLNSCSCMASDSMAQAFNTVGYSNRASLGWYSTINISSSKEWWSYFKNVAGTTDLRSACLAAADNCAGSTPIRIYGDKTWYGFAW